MIEFEKRSEVKAKIYGTEYTLRRPTVGQLESLDELIRTGDDKSKLKMMKDFMGELGLPIDVSSNMEADHFNKLVEHITGAADKKK